MGLLIQWLSNSESVPLEAEGYSFQTLLIRWMQGVLGSDDNGTPANDSWPAVRRLFDFLEANAGSYWTVPTLAEAEGGVTKARASESPTSNADEEGPLEEETASDEESLFEAAYEGVVYRDSTRDGREGDTLESGPNRETAEVDALTRFFEPRLRFINTLAQAWLMAALRFAAAPRDAGPARGKSAEPSREEVIAGWRRKARMLSRDLSRLADELAQYEIELPSGDHDENVEYDYQRHAQLYLMHTVVLTQVRLRMAERLLSAQLAAGRPT